MTASQPDFTFAGEVAVTVHRPGTGVPLMIDQAADLARVLLHLSRESQRHDGTRHVRK